MELQTVSVHSLLAALVFPIGFDSTGAPFALQLSAPAGMDGMLMSLGLALEKLFGPMPAPPATAACSGCSSNVFYTNVSPLTAAVAAAAAAAMAAAEQKCDQAVRVSPKVDLCFYNAWLHALAAPQLSPYIFVS